MNIPRIASVAQGNHALLTQRAEPIVYVEDSGLKMAIDMYCENDLNIQVTSGWESVIRAVQKARNEIGNTNVYGLIDSDYHAFFDRDGVTHIPGIIMTDLRDLEMDMIKCGAGEKLLVAVKDTTKKSAPNKMLSLLKMMEHVTKHRIFNHINQKCWKFNTYEIYKSWKKTRFNQGSFNAPFFKRNELNKNDIIAIDDHWQASNIDLWLATRGHDISSYFVNRLKGNNLLEDQFTIELDSIEERLIEAAEATHICKLGWIRKIQNLK